MKAAWGRAKEGERGTASGGKKVTVGPTGVRGFN